MISMISMNCIYYKPEFIRGQAVIQETEPAVFQETSHSVAATHKPGMN